ncbi:MAG TPA: hypothetical protein VLE02_01925 [Nitrosarchaeum sp.]|nr:hypothetical protein [Nitrosarchaeum sp.]
MSTILKAVLKKVKEVHGDKITGSTELAITVEKLTETIQEKLVEMVAQVVISLLPKKGDDESEVSEDKSEKKSKSEDKSEKKKKSKPVEDSGTSSDDESSGSKSGKKKKNVKPISKEDILEKLKGEKKKAINTSTNRAINFETHLKKNPSHKLFKSEDGKIRLVGSPNSDETVKMLKLCGISSKKEDKVEAPSKKKKSLEFEYNATYACNVIKDTKWVVDSDKKKVFGKIGTKKIVKLTKADIKSLSEENIEYDDTEEVFDAEMETINETLEEAEKAEREKEEKERAAKKAKAEKEAEEAKKAKKEAEAKAEKEAEEAKKEKAKKEKAKKGKGKKEESDDDDIELVSDDEEEEEKPKKSKGKKVESDEEEEEEKPKKGKKVESDEEETAEEEEEEEEEKPKKGKKVESDEEEEEEEKPKKGGEGKTKKVNEDVVDDTVEQLSASLSKVKSKSKK